MADIPVKQTKEETLEPATSGQVQVSQGNVPIVTVQLLNDINMKLGKIVTILEELGK